MRSNPDFDALREVVLHAERAEPLVSSWSVGEHVHHCCLSMIGIVRSLEKSTPPAPPAPFSFPRTAVFLFGRIPRGRARSPEQVVPRAGIAADELLAMIDESSRQIERAGGLDRAAWVRHPLLGPLRRDRALEFVRIHNRHHLRIMADIVKHAR